MEVVNLYGGGYQFYYTHRSESDLFLLKKTADSLNDNSTCSTGFNLDLLTYH